MSRQTHVNGDRQWYAYRLYDGNGTLLYSGSTCNLQRRFSEHGGRGWTREVRYAAIETYPARWRAALAERAAGRGTQGFYPGGIGRGIAATMSEDEMVEALAHRVHLSTTAWPVPARRIRELRERAKGVVPLPPLAVRWLAFRRGGLSIRTAQEITNPLPSRPIETDVDHRLREGPVMTTLDQVIEKARDLYGPTPAAFDYAYGLGDAQAEAALERAIYLAAGEGTDPDRDAVEVRALRLQGGLEPELEAFRRVCRDRRYVGWSRWSSGPIRYADEAEAVDDREVQVAQVTNPPDTD